MIYAFRRAVLEDLTGLLDALAPCYGADPRVHAALPCFWEKMLETGAMVATVSLDTTDPLNSVIVGAGASLMAHPCFPQSVLASNKGGFGEHAVRRTLKGEPTALSLQEIQAANAGEGSDAVILHHAFFKGRTMAENPPEVLECQAASFYEFHRGIKFHSFHQSCLSADEFHWMLGSGLRYRPRPGEVVPPVAPTPDVPALVGARSDELAMLWGTRAARMFAFHPPRLGLKALHRDLLEPALAGFTDEEIAEELSLSLSAVKKRWAALYEQIEETCPGVLGEPARSNNGNGSRGTERRRHLLQYVSRHSEEMNPQAGH